MILIEVQFIFFNLMLKFNDLFYLKIFRYLAVNVYLLIQQSESLHRYELFFKNPRIFRTIKKKRVIS